ncbi:MAG: glycoside hydrolase family 95 protein [Devosia sp.]
MKKLELWYSNPATIWNEALPIGNGRLGAMVFGDLMRERLQINESTFFTGGPYSPVNSEARGHLDKVRSLIFEGRYREAEDLANQHMMGKPYLQTSYQPIGDVWITFHHGMHGTDYRRSLDLETAIASTRYGTGRIDIRRDAFASAVAGVIVYRIEAQGGGDLFLDLALASPQPGEIIESDEASLLYAGNNRSEQGIKGELRFAYGLKVVAEGGVINATPDTLRVQGASRVTIFIDAATSYRRFDDVTGDPTADVRDRLAAAAALPYSLIRDEHIKEHQRLFSALSIDLGASASSQRPTDLRIAEPDPIDGPALAALFTQYGRYFTISSSRPGTQPSNLQGIWNEEIRPSWGSKYTTNINLEMNYWLPDPANISECFEPLIAMVEDLSITGRRTADVHYGARGWVLHHNTDLWRATAPVDGPLWGLWPMGGAWLCAQLWDHYQFTLDHRTLARIYPLMKGATEFLLDYLVAHPDTGQLVTVPSLSPENAHPHGSSLCAGPAIDNQIIRDLFTGVIEAATLLRTDEVFQRTVASALTRIAPDSVGAAGHLQEWSEDWDNAAPDPHHRHVSHLYGLYPSQQINLDETPALALAARRSLEMRGDEATGWGIGWRLNLWARLRDGQRANEVITRLLRSDRTYPNLFDAHPPFQIDGNFGGAAGVLEMLAQSRRGLVHLLPALPDAWPEGRVAGLGCRGGIITDIAWSEGALSEALLVSSIDQRIDVRYRADRAVFDLKAGTPMRIDRSHFQLRVA